MSERENEGRTKKNVRRAEKRVKTNKVGKKDEGRKRKRKEGEETLY